MLGKHTPTDPLWKAQSTKGWCCKWVSDLDWTNYCKFPNIYIPCQLHVVLFIWSTTAWLEWSMKRIQRSEVAQEALWQFSNDSVSHDSPHPKFRSWITSWITSWINVKHVLRTLLRIQGMLQVWFQLVIEPVNRDWSALNSEQNNSALASASLHPSLCVLYFYRNAMYIYLLPSSTCNELAFNYTMVYSLPCLESPVGGHVLKFCSGPSWRLQRHMPSVSADKYFMKSEIYE